jgi:hypothetical protein
MFGMLLENGERMPLPFCDTGVGRLERNESWSSHFLHEMSQYIIG